MKVSNCRMCNRTLEGLHSNTVYCSEVCKRRYRAIKHDENPEIRNLLVTIGKNLEELYRGTRITGSSNALGVLIESNAVYTEEYNGIKMWLLTDHGWRLYQECVSKEQEELQK